LIINPAPSKAAHLANIYFKQGSGELGVAESEPMILVAQTIRFQAETKERLSKNRR
jgi:hypothetical protein